MPRKETMNNELEDRIIARVGKVAIGQYTYGWWVADVRLAGPDAKTPGAEVLRAQTFHGSLASACRAAALRVADLSEATSLQCYALSLDGAVAELGDLVRSGALVECPKDRNTAAGDARSGANGVRSPETPRERPERQIRKVSATPGTFRATRVPRTRKRRNG